MPRLPWVFSYGRSPKRLLLTTRWNLKLGGAGCLMYEVGINNYEPDAI